jgi:RNA polymerase sigma factor (sigma-70 family)
MVHGTCLRILGDSHEAEDVAQECFMELATKAGTVTRSLPGWLHAAATSRSLGTIRSSAKRRKREEEVMLNEGENTAPTWEAVAPVVDQALDQLPEDLRNPLVLHYLQGKDQTEVAEKLGISQSTVSRRLETGVDELRKKLQTAGIVASVAILANLLTAHAATAAPAALVAVLGKMAMAGVGKVGGTASTAATAAHASTGILGTTAGKLGVVVIAGAIVIIGVVVHMQASKSAPTPPPSPATVTQSHAATEPLATATTTRRLPHAMPSKGKTLLPSGNEIKKGTDAPLLQIEPTGTCFNVKGRLVDAQGQPATNGVFIVATTIRYHRVEDVVLRTAPNDDGTFSIDFPRNEISNVRITFHDSEGTVLGGFAYVYVDTDFGTLTLRKDCALAGTVLAPGSMAVKEVPINVFLRVYTNDSNFDMKVATVASDAEGRFSVENLGPGNYTLIAKKDDLFVKNDVRLVPGENHLDLAMNPGATITGTITREDGKPLGNVDVTAKADKTFKTSSDEAGRYSFTGLPNAARYYVKAECEGYVAVDGGKSVPLSAGLIATQDIKMAQSACVVLEITNSADYSVMPAIASVGITPPHARDAVSYTSWMRQDCPVVDSHVRVHLLPGKYRLQIEDDTFASTAVDVDVTAGEVITQQVFLVQAFEIDARVMDSDGDFLYNQSVTATYLGPCEGEGLPHVPRPKHNSYEYNNHTDDQGIFFIRELQCGRYKVEVACGPEERSNPVIINITSSTNLALCFDPMFRWVYDRDGALGKKDDSVLPTLLPGAVGTPLPLGAPPPTLSTAEQSNEMFRVQILALKRMKECLLPGRNGVRFKTKKGFDIMAVYYKSAWFLDSEELRDEDGNKCVYGMTENGEGAKILDSGVMLFAIPENKKAKEFRSAFPDGRTSIVDVSSLDHGGRESGR